MPDDVHFGIIEQIDQNKHYDVIDIPFDQILVKYHCVDIPDDIVNEWIRDMADISTHWHWYGREAKNLAQYGVTLIPPESLDEVLRVVQRYKLPAFYSKKNRTKINRFINLLNQAKTQKKWVIHFGL